MHICREKIRNVTWCHTSMHLCNLNNEALSDHMWCSSKKKQHIFTLHLSLCSLSFQPWQFIGQYCHWAWCCSETCLILVVLMGLWLPAVPYWTLWLLVILSAPPRFIWSLDTLEGISYAEYSYMYTFQSGIIAANISFLCIVDLPLISLNQVSV